MAKVVCAVFLAAFVMILFGSDSTLANEFRVEFTGAIYDTGTDSVLNTDYPFSVKIYFTASDVDNGWSTPFVFYGTDQVTNLWSPGEITINPDFLSCWGLFNTVEYESWDGDLTNGSTIPGDQFNFSGVALNNALQCLTTEENLIFEIDFVDGLVNNSNLKQFGQFCIDSGDFDNDSFDWLFNPPVFFNGPYCIPVGGMIPVANIVNCPQYTLVVEPGGQITYDFDTDWPGSTDFSMVSGPGAVDILTGEWMWQTEVSDKGKHTVEICGVYEGMECIPRLNCNFTVLVGVCGDVNGDGQVNLLDVTAMILYIYNGYPLEIPDAIDVNGDGTANLLDVIYLVNYLYKDGPAPVC